MSFHSLVYLVSIFSLLFSEAFSQCHYEEFEYDYNDFNPSISRVDFNVVDEICEPTCPLPSKEEEVVLIPFMRGVVLMNDPMYLCESEWDTINGLKIIGLELNAKEIYYLTQTLEPLFLGKALTESTLVKIKHAIIRFYQNRHYPLVDVRLPEQDVTDGVLQLVVIESRAGEIRSKGSRWFDGQCLCNSVSQEVGALINTDLLTADVIWLNRNPFRHTDIVFTPGKYPGTTDIELVTTDRMPFKMYAGWDDHGTNLVGTNRRFAGFVFGDVWGCGHTLAYQYTTSLNWQNLRAHGGEYIAPLPCHQTFHVFGGHAEVKDTFHKNRFHHHGQSSQGSLRYRIMYDLSPVSFQEFSFGGDFKNTNNTLLFSEKPVFANQVNLTQIVLDYYYEYQDPFRQTSLDLALYYSPGEWIQHQSNKDYNHLRLGARNRYAYGQFSLENTFYLPQNFSVYWNFQVQGATTNLLPSEQFGLGGYDTVRGYQERVVNGDNALLTNLEIYTPSYSFLKDYRGLFCDPVTDSFYFLLFVDYGIAHNAKLYGNEKVSQYLLGIGPGLRYVCEPYFSLSLDCGFQLHQLDGCEGSKKHNSRNNPSKKKHSKSSGVRSRVHFSAIASF
jgi:hemolysin activation/secretion protein